MKVYVASKFQNMNAVRAAIAALEKDGHEITCDWTIFDDTKLVADVQRVLEMSSSSLTPSEDLSAAQARLKKYRAHCATTDIYGVAEADAFVMLMVDGMKGAWLELGLAIAATQFRRARSMRVLVVGAAAQPQLDTVFLHLPFVEHFETFEQARVALGPKVGTDDLNVLREKI